MGESASRDEPEVLRRARAELERLAENPERTYEYARKLEDARVLVTMIWGAWQDGYEEGLQKVVDSLAAIAGKSLTESLRETEADRIATLVSQMNISQAAMVTANLQGVRTAEEAEAALRAATSQPQPKPA